MQASILTSPYGQPSLSSALISSALPLYISEINKYRNSSLEPTVYAVTGLYFMVKCYFYNLCSNWSVFVTNGYPVRDSPTVSG